MQRPTPYPRELGPLDIAVLGSETPNRPMHTTTLFVLDASERDAVGSIDVLNESLAEALQHGPGLDCVLHEVAFGLSGARLEQAGNWNARHHIRSLHCPAPGGPRQLAATVGGFHAGLLNRNRPLCDARTVDGLASGSLAVLLKLHAVPHALSVDRRIASLTHKDAERHDPHPSAAPAAPSPTSLAELAEALPKLALQPWRFAARGADALTRALREPVALLAGLPHLAPSSVLNAPTRPGRQVAFVSLRRADVESLTRHIGVGTRAVCLGLLGEALRRTLAARGAPPHRSLVAAVVGPDEGPGSSAEARVQCIPLATDMRRPIDRVTRIEEALRHAATPDPMHWTSLVAPLLDATPVSLFPALGQLLSQAEQTGLLPNLANVLFSVSREAGGTRHLARARIEHEFRFAPSAPALPLHVHATLRAASIDVAFSSCPSALPDLWPMAVALSSSLAEWIDAFDLRSA